MIISVFTEKYTSLQRRILNKIIIEESDNAFPAKAQWDTGATNTCISKELVKKLELKPTGKINVQTPSGTDTMNQYMVNLILNNEVKFCNCIVMDSEIGNQGIDVLIGMDIIRYGDFAISNFDEKTQFSFRVPSQEHIEFQKETIE